MTGVLKKPDMPRGIVDPEASARRIRLAHYPPCAPLLPFVELFWIVEWDVPAPQVQRTLPFPNAHLVFERGRSALHGVCKGPFDRTLEGAGRVLGVKFHAGGARPFLQQPLATVTDATLPLSTILGDADGAEATVLGAGDDAAMVAAASALLLARLPAPDPLAQQALRIVQTAAREGGPTSVAALCELTGMGERAMQRLFAEYVGVSPKWVIRRYRLQELAMRLARSEYPDLATLAAELGFSDQAHMTRDFTRLIGKSPRDYWASQQ